MANEISGFNEEELDKFETFRTIMERLRGPGGCPWDRQQTHDSLKKYLVEECYEVLETIDRNDMPALSEELGDLWLQIMLHSQIAEESGEFTLEDVLRKINTKMITATRTSSAGRRSQTLKKFLSTGRRLKSGRRTGATRCWPAYRGACRRWPTASRSGGRVAPSGFDWEKADDIIEKLVEEVEELRKAATHEERIMSSAIYCWYWPM